MTLFDYVRLNLTGAGGMVNVLREYHLVSPPQTAPLIPSGQISSVTTATAPAASLFALASVASAGPTSREFLEH